MKDLSESTLFNKKRTPTFDTNLSKLEKIGEGGFSQVFRGKYLTLPVAIKVMKCSEEEIGREISIIGGLLHNKLPILYGTTSNSIILQLIEGHTLENFVDDGNSCENDIIKLKIVLDFSLILHFIHLNNIVHRDLKPKNIMVDFKSISAKIIDFGISKRADKTEYIYERKGTMGYYTPEHVLQELEHESSLPLSKKMDVWAAGLIINKVFSGDNPWSFTNYELPTQIIGFLMNKKEFIPSEKIRIEGIRDLILCCTKYNREVRYDSTKLLAHLLLILFKAIKQSSIDELYQHIKRDFGLKASKLT